MVDPNSIQNQTYLHMKPKSKQTADKDSNNNNNNNKVKCQLNGKPSLNLREEFPEMEPLESVDVWIEANPKVTIHTVNHLSR